MIGGTIQVIHGSPARIYETKVKQHIRGEQRAFNKLFNAGIVNFDRTIRGFYMKFPKIVVDPQKGHYPAVQTPKSIRLMQYFISIYQAYQSRECRSALVAAAVNSGFALNFKTKETPALALFVNPYDKDLPGWNGIHTDVVYFNHMTQKPDLCTRPDMKTGPKLLFGLFGATISEIKSYEMRASVTDALRQSRIALDQAMIHKYTNVQTPKMTSRAQARELIQVRNSLETFSSLPRLYHGLILLLHTFGSRMVNCVSNFTRADTKKADARCAHYMEIMIRAYGRDIFGLDRTTHSIELSSVYSSLGVYGNPFAMVVRYGFEQCARILTNKLDERSFSVLFAKQSISKSDTGGRACIIDRNRVKHVIEKNMYDLPGVPQLDLGDQAKLAAAAAAGTIDYVVHQ